MQNYLFRSKKDRSRDPRIEIVNNDFFFKREKRTQTSHQVIDTANGQISPVCLFSKLVKLS